MSERDEVLVEVVVAAPADVVWRALRDPSEIRRWFGWDYPELEAEIAYMFVDHAEASDAERVVRIGGGVDRISLEARGERTLVRVIRSAPAPEGSTSWKDVYDDEHEGWISFLQQLRFALERHPGRDRRTLYLSGHATDRVPVPLRALGLAGVATLGEGEGYAVRVEPGDELAGKVWFRSPHQLGLTVDAWGEGLLIVTAHPERERSPRGGGQALLTSCGADEEAWRALCSRWTAWWRERYERPAVAP
jgi:hypothetical protein